MKTSKKFFSILMSTVIMLSMFVAVLSITSFASGTWEYVIAEAEGEVYITRCSSDLHGDVVIPEKIEGLPVTVVDSQAFDNAVGPITSITISKNIRLFGDHQELEIFESPSFYLEDLEKIIVHKDNEYYSSDSNGVLYDKDKTQLILYPEGSKAKSYTFPDTVSVVFDDVFFSPFLETITISKSVESLSSWYPANELFYTAESLKKIIVDAENSVYSSDKNGILFDKNKTELLFCPMSSTVTEYTVPSSVEYIVIHAFVCNKNLRKIDLNNVKSVAIDAFIDCDSLQEMILPKTLEDIVDAISDCPSLKSISYEGTKAEWAEVFGSDEEIFANITFLGDKGKNNEKITVPATDKNGITVENTETVTDEDSDTIDNDNYNDNYNSNYNNDYDADYSSGSTGSDKDKSDNKVLKIVLPIAAVVLVLIGIVVFIIIKDKKGKSSYKKPAKTQTKTIQKERTLSEDDLPGFVTFLGENKPTEPSEQGYVSEDDSGIIYPVGVPGPEVLGQDDFPTTGVFEYKPEMDNISQKTHADATEETENYEPEIQPDEKTQSWFDTTNL